MIPSGTAKATMEEFNIEQGEHIPQDGPKSSYAKRSNVVGMWRKKEEELKALKSKEQQTRQMQYEEKKESTEEFEHDSRQQETDYSDMFPSDPFADVVPETNEQEPAETSFEQRTPATAPRRSNVRDSWKKKAASPSTYSSQPSPGINESPSNASATAFDELKSKWKKFGVENGGHAKPDSIEKKIADRKVGVKAEEKQTPEKVTEKATEQAAKSSESKLTSRSIAARRIGSNRFRSRVGRKPTTISASNSTDEIMDASEGSTTPDKKVSDSPSQSAPVIEKELVPPFPTDELDTRETPKSPVVNYSRHNEVTPTSPLSPASTISRSSLSERANRRLRDIRTKSQPRNEEDEEIKPKESKPKETKPKKAADLDTSDMPMDESIAFKESMRSQGSNLTNDNFVDAHTSPLNTVVPNMENMVPDQFFSEKDANVDSMRSVIQQTSFVQIAKDMRDEAGTLMEFDFISEGVHSALYALGLEDMFPVKSPKKSIKRSPSPVEEVAIEVEYVADGEE